MTTLWRVTTAIDPSAPASQEATVRQSRVARRTAVYLTLATVSLINLISYAPLDVRAHEKAWGDALNYYAMSEHTGAQVDNPFALRMLSPWLVHLAGKVTGLPLDVLWLGFTAAVTLACTVVFFEFCWRHLNLQLFTSAVAAIALGCTFWYGPYAFSNPFLVDPLNNLLYLVALWLVFKRKLVLFTVVIVVGAINKETTLLLAPLYPLLAWTRAVAARPPGAFRCTGRGGCVGGIRWLPHVGTAPDREHLQLRQRTRKPQPRLEHCLRAIVEQARRARRTLRHVPLLLACLRLRALPAIPPERPA